MSNFWDVLWTIVIAFAFVTYLMILFGILADLFRDTTLGGWAKAVWILFLVWVPYLTAFVYLIARGRGMAERQQAAAIRGDEATRAYIRDAAGSSPSAEIERAKGLLDSGAISSDEFAALKAKALR